MIHEYKTKTNIGVGLGFLLQWAGGILGKEDVIGSLMILVGSLFFIWGCSNYAQGKGYSNWFGALGNSGVRVKCQSEDVGEHG